MSIMESSSHGNTHYELLLQEIEGIDDYWGSTFRAIYDSGDHQKFREQLEARIKYHDKEIERICNTYYQGFIDSIKDLQEVRNQAKQLQIKIMRTDESLQQLSARMEKICNDLRDSRSVISNNTSTINNLRLCLPVFAAYRKLQKQIHNKRYYPALKTLEQLEHLYLPPVSQYRFFQQLKQNIPQIRENIKEVSMSDLKDFLENIRRLSPKIGDVAMKQTMEQQGVDPDVLIAKSKNKRCALLPLDPSDGNVNPLVEDPSLDSEDDLCAQHLIDFSPIYRCHHIYTVLASRDVFENYYRSQRKKQARLAVIPPSAMHEMIGSYRLYLQGIIGFFVVEDHILNTSNGLIDKPYLDDLWTSSLIKITTALRTHSAYCTDANLMLKIKQLIISFCATLRNYGYSVNQFMELLHDIRDQYNEILMQRWVQVFRGILDKEIFLPITVTNSEEYEEILEMFPFNDSSLEMTTFPKKFPFSMMVPRVYQQVKEFIYATLKFSEDLNLNQSEVDDITRKSTNLLLMRTFSGCLSSLFRKPNLALMQVIQIIIDTGYLENSSVYLEEFVSNITGSAIEGHQLGMRNKGHLFKVAKDDAERQVCVKLQQKLDEFLELENYDWMLTEPKGHASSFITDMIAFLKTIFQAFTNLPADVGQKACQSACKHIAKSILSFMTSEYVKQISIGALQQINLDTIQCEQFAASEPVPGLQDGILLQYFNDLRQLLDLLMSWDWSSYFHDYGQENNKYQHVNPVSAITILEKLKEADKKSVFSALKKSERDKKKLLETVLKQLRQLALVQQQ